MKYIISVLTVMLIVLVVQAHGSVKENQAQERGNCIVDNVSEFPAGELPYRPYVLSTQTKGYLIEDVWPSLYFGDEAVAEIKRKAKNLSWAKKAMELMKQEAEIVMKAPPCLPIELAGWRHDFFSRSTAEHLVFDPNSPDSYFNPLTGNYEYDPAERSAWVLLAHERTYRMMRSVGVLYGITGDERYAKWVAEGMRKAAEYFTHKEFLREDRAAPALYMQNLYDASMLMLLANDYSLTRRSPAYSALDHENIRTNIFEDRLPSMLEFLNNYSTLNKSCYNMACYVSGAIACIGDLYDRPDLMKAALGRSSGLYDQLMNGLPTDENGQVDGLWFEGTLFYHFYSMCPLISLWQTDRLIHGGLASDPVLKHRFIEMFKAPVAIIDQQLRLPLIGDLGAPRTMNLAGYRHIYEYAAGQLSHKEFAPVLASIYEKSGAPRTDLAALAYGPDTLPKPGGVPKGDTLLPVSRMGVFRSGGPEQLYLTFRAGKYLIGHDHPDRLTIALNAFGELISPDLGEPGYSLRDANFRYYRSTIAHNTLFADEQSQTGDAVLDWRPDSKPACARGTITGADGISYQRTIFFDAPYVVLLDEYSAATSHRYGWAYHAYGALKVSGAELGQNVPPSFGMPPLPNTAEFALLIDRYSGTLTGTLSATWRVSDKIRLHMMTTSDGPFEVNTAISPGNPYPDTLGVVILRAQGATRRFATVLDPSKGPSSVSKISLEGDIVTLSTVDGTGRTYQWK